MSKGTDRNVGILRRMERENCSRGGRGTEENREREKFYVTRL
jgi:hypothetical protein